MLIAACDSFHTSKSDVMDFQQTVSREYNAGTKGETVAGHRELRPLAVTNTKIVHAKLCRAVHGQKIASQLRMCYTPHIRI